MSKLKFYHCEHCGHISIDRAERKLGLKCCGADMQLLNPNTVDASNEKHLPVVDVNGSSVKVSVGSVTHPMGEDHWIQLVCLETTNGYQIKYLNPGEAPEACFELCSGEKEVAAYEYCNLHGLWITKL